VVLVGRLSVTCNERSAASSEVPAASEKIDEAAVHECRDEDRNQHAFEKVCATVINDEYDVPIEQRKRQQARHNGEPSQQQFSIDLHVRANAIGPRRQRRGLELIRIAGLATRR
jgi:hypothetical protein